MQNKFRRFQIYLDKRNLEIFRYIQSYLEVFRQKKIGIFRQIQNNLDIFRDIMTKQIQTNLEIFRESKINLDVFTTRSVKHNFEFFYDLHSRIFFIFLKVCEVHRGSQKINF